MKYKTTRFGEISFQQKDIIHMPKGVLGFEQLGKYVIVEKEESKPFKWYQSLENPDVAFVIIDPTIFFPNYRLTINEKEVADIDSAEPNQLIVYVIVTVSSDPSQTSVNLQGPILINPDKNLAKQMVMVTSPYTTRHYIFDALKKQLKLQGRQPNHKTKQALRQNRYF